MKEKEITEELWLCIRSFIEAKERSTKNSIDNFDELRILEASFNRLFISVEHLCNAIMLLEKGNFSKKHFGDVEKLKSLKEKYKSDLGEIYRKTYSFRSFADYRKFPEIKDTFTRIELKKQIEIVNKAINESLKIIGDNIDVKTIFQRLEKRTLS